MAVRVYYDTWKTTQSWGLNTDLICDSCGTLQSYTQIAYAFDCKCCDEKIPIPIYLIHKKYPIVFNNYESRDNFKEKYEAFLLTMKMLDFKEFRCRPNDYRRTGKRINTSYYNEEINIELTVLFDVFGNYQDVSAIFKSRQTGITFKDDIVDKNYELVFNEIYEAI